MADSHIYSDRVRISVLEGAIAPGQAIEVFAGLDHYVHRAGDRVASSVAADVRSRARRPAAPAYLCFLQLSGDSGVSGIVRPACGQEFSALGASAWVTLGSG